MTEFAGLVSHSYSNFYSSRYTNSWVELLFVAGNKGTAITTKAHQIYFPYQLEGF